MDAVNNQQTMSKCTAVWTNFTIVSHLQAFKKKLVKWKKNPFLNDYNAMIWHKFFSYIIWYANSYASLSKVPLWTSLLQLPCERACVTLAKFIFLVGNLIRDLATNHGFAVKNTLNGQHCNNKYEMTNFPNAKCSVSRRVFIYHWKSCFSISNRLFFQFRNWVFFLFQIAFCKYFF